MITINQNDIRRAIFGDIKWEVFIHPEDEYSNKVLTILKENNQKNVVIRDIDKERLYQALTQIGIFYTPVVYKDGILFGSYTEVNSLFSRRIFTEKDLGRI